MYCKNCGEKLQDNDKICSKCGTNVQGKDNNISKKEQATHMVNEGKNVLLRFFTEYPGGVIEEMSKSRSHIGFALVAINTILFAFVTCFNIPQSGVYILNSLVNTVQKMATSISGSSFGGSMAGSMMPTIKPSPCFDLFIPMIFLALVLLAVEFAGMYIALRVKHQKINHYLNAVNIIGVATLPLSAVLILNFVLGFIYPIAAPFVFVTAIFIHMVVIYDGLRHITSDNKAPFICFSIISAIICIVMIVVLAIAVNKINDVIQQSILDTINGAISGVFGGIFDSILG